MSDPTPDAGEAGDRGASTSPAAGSLTWSPRARVVVLSVLALSAAAVVWVASPGLGSSLDRVAGWLDRTYTQQNPSDKIWRAALNVAASVGIGLLGAWAYYFGVYSGFIDRDTRDRVLQYLWDEGCAPPETHRRWRRAAFFLFGGVVAGVFQAAQADTFTPIQAFVLGITWPSVVSRSMSGGGVGAPLASALNRGEGAGDGAKGTTTSVRPAEPVPGEVVIESEDSRSGGSVPDVLTPGAVPPGSAGTG
ncbi:MAG TPA: hypothetical protein VF796_04640 [Humisphaera sp.]